MKIDIRLIKPSDFPQLITLIKEFAAFQKSEDKMSNSLERMQKEGAFIQGFAAFSKEKMLAYVTFFDAYYTWSGRSLYLEDLYVTPKQRGKGLGSKLINQVILQAKAQGCARLRWQVSSWNQKAISFYRKIGAKIDDTESNCDIFFPKEGSF